MPEIYECIFGLAQLLRFFTKEDKKLEKDLDNYENQTLYDMAEIRSNLFKDFGYKSEPSKAF